eukprot:5493726-Pyramimonas_sp.AAC.1
MRLPPPSPCLPPLAPAPPPPGPASPAPPLLLTPPSSSFLVACTSYVCPQIQRAGEASSRPCEATNSMIKLQGDRSPAISLELLSSRVQLKHELHVPTAGSIKYSHISAAVEKVWSSCCEHLDDIGPVMGDAERWAAPAPVPLSDLPTDATIKRKLGEHKPALQMTDELVWASAFNLHICNACKDISAKCLAPDCRTGTRLL